MKVVLLSELTFILQPMGTAQRSGAILRISGASEAKDSLPQKINLSQNAIRNTCLLCTFAFFIMVSYSIFLERCYRVKYDWVVKNREYTDFLFLNLSPKRRPVTEKEGEYKEESFSLCLSLRRSISLPTVFFYGVLLALMWFVLVG